MKVRIIALILILVGFSSGQTIPKTMDASINEAQRVWELAIKAKGGREKLYSIRNIQNSSVDYIYFGLKKVRHPQSLLVVYPDKMWSWDDYRPGVFGLQMRMYNYAVGKFYIAQEGDKAVKLKRIQRDELVSRRFFPRLIWLLMETRWQKPIPEKLTSARIKFRKVDVVQTRLNGNRIDFFLNRKTHLPIRVDFYNPNLGKEGEHLDVSGYLSKYYEQDGMMVPKKVDGVKQTYRFNVEYNEDIFKKAPLPVTKAANAWRKGWKNGVNR